MQDIDLRCVILNYQGYEMTSRCIQALIQSGLEATRMILVDNGSAGDDASKLGGKFPDISVIALERNVGFSAGMNAGIRHALRMGCDYVLLLNNDTLMSPEALKELRTAASKRPDAWILVPNQAFHSSLLRPSRSSKTVQAEVRTVIRAAAFCWLVRTTAFKVVGLFDEQFFFGREDLDYSRRLTRFGHPILEVQQALVYHKSQGSDSAEENIRELRAYHMARGCGLYLSKHFRGLSLLYQGLATVPLLLRDILAMQVSYGLGTRWISLTLVGFVHGLGFKTDGGRHRHPPTGI